MSIRSQLACAVALAGLVLGCTPPDKWKIVRDIDLEAPGGEPRITNVRDLGSVPLIMNKPLRHDKSDQVAVPGELLVIRGQNLGKQPQVTFGPTPLQVLARTEDGGIVVRAPKGTTPGDLDVSVSNHKGTASKKMSLRRFALATIPGIQGIQVVEVSPSGPKAVGKPLLATAPKFISYDRHGSVAYVTTGGARPKLLIVDMAGAGGPRITNQRLLGQWRVIGMSAASDAKRIAVVHETAILVFDLDDPRDPYRFNPARLPPGIRKLGVQDLKLSPDGKTLAVLVASRNAIVLFDLSDPNKVRNTSFIPLLPGAKAPLVRGLHFSYEPRSPIKQILWVSTGDTLLSSRVGKHDPKLLKIGITSSNDRVTLPRAKVLGEIPIPGARAPMAIDTTYSVRQLSAATVLRREPSKMLFFIGAMHPDLFLLDKHRLDTPTGLQQGAELLRRLGNFGSVIRADHRGRGSAIHSVAALPTSVTITGDARMLLAVACKPDVKLNPPRVEVPCGVLAKELGKDGKGSFHAMGQLPLAAFRPPFDFGVIKVQP